MSQDSTDLKHCGISSHDFAYQHCHVSLKSEEHCQNVRTILNRLIGFRQSRSPGMTYLLSVSRLRMLHNTFPLDTIKHLLSTPHGVVIFLVPVELLSHPHLFNYARLPKARDSCLQILPFDPVETVNDDQVADCVGKICKQRTINGFM